MECRTAGREIIWALQRHGHFENQDGRLAQLVSAQALRDFEMHFVVVVETREVREEVEVVETVEADLHVLRPVEMMENVEAVVVVVEVVVRRAT